MERRDSRSRRVTEYALLARNTEATRSSTVNAVKDYWVIPVKQWVEPVSRLKGVTIMAQVIFDPGGDSPWYLRMLRPGPRSELLTGNPTSKEELTDVPRDYRRGSGKTSELNNFVKEMIDHEKQTCGRGCPGSTQRP
jgi:hypothetical protein